MHHELKTQNNHFIFTDAHNLSFAGKTDNLNGIYADEDQCIDAFRKYKLQSRILCKGCNVIDFLWLLSANKFRCKNCGYQSGLKCGTLLENLNLPVSYLFVALHVLLKHNNIATATLLEQITGYKNAERLSVLLEKIKTELTWEDKALLLMCFIESQDNDKEYII